MQQWYPTWLTSRRAASPGAQTPPIATRVEAAAPRYELSCRIRSPRAMLSADPAELQRFCMPGGSAHSHTAGPAGQAHCVRHCCSGSHMLHSSRPGCRTIGLSATHQRAGTACVRGQASAWQLQHILQVLTDNHAAKPVHQQLLVVAYTAFSDTMQVYGCRMAPGMSQNQQGELCGLPCWSSDSLYVAIPLRVEGNVSSLKLVMWHVDADVLTAVTSQTAYASHTAALLWAPPAQYGHQVAMQMRSDFSTRVSLAVTSPSGWLIEAEVGHRSAEQTDHRDPAAGVSWSPDVSRIALVLGHALLIASTASRTSQVLHHLADSRLFAWAPCGRWLLGQACLVQLQALEQEGTATAAQAFHSQAVASTLDNCVALTWGKSGVVALAACSLLSFCLVDGPSLVPLQRWDFQADVHDPTFMWAPSGDWLTCLAWLTEEAESEAAFVLLVHLETSFLCVLPCALRGYNAPDERPATKSTTKCVWAPDACGMWVGVFHLSFGAPSVDDANANQQWLLRFF